MTNHTEPAMVRRLLRTAVVAAVTGIAAAAFVAHLDPRPTAAAGGTDRRLTDASLVHRLTALESSPLQPPRVFVASAVPTATPAPPPPIPAPAALVQAVAAPRPAAAAPVHAAAPPPPPHAPAAVPSGAVSAIVQLVNQDRASSGLPALQWSDALGRAAANHAAQNAANDQMSHNGLDQDVAAQGVHWNSLGECLGWNSGSGPDPSMINQMWMTSSDHHAIIMGSYTTLGVGWAESSSGKWYVSLIVIS